VFQNCERRFPAIIKEQSDVLLSIARPRNEIALAHRSTLLFYRISLVWIEYSLAPIGYDRYNVGHVLLKETYGNVRSTIDLSILR
jgi:hypothetical protein